MNLPVLPAHRSILPGRTLVPQFVLRHVCRVLLVLVLFATLVTPNTSDATIVVPVADTALTQQASDIVIGKIVDLHSTWDENHEHIFTQIKLRVGEVLKGDVRTHSLTVTQHGGIVGDVESWIDGNPQFTVGEKVLLFLARKADGSLHVLHLYQGKFSLFIDADSGVEFAYRESHPEGVQVMSGAQHLEQRSTMEANVTDAALTQSGFLPLADLKARIHDTLTNPTSAPLSQPLAPLVTPPSSSPAVTREAAPFTLLGSPAARWFEPDTNQSVSMKINTTNSPSGASAAVQSALTAWTGVSGSSFKFQNSGSTSSTGMSSDGINAISFGDPLGQIDPPSGCSGVLAIGGYYRSGSTTVVVNGTTYYKIVEGDLVFADGWTGCGFYENPANVAEVATHELGHVIGLGHSADSTATMYAYAHFDGRGAAIRADDIAGLQSIYPGAATPLPSPCTYTVSSTSLSVGASASSSTVNVTLSSSACTWTATSNVSWITITVGASSTGNGSVTFSIAANASSVGRSGTLTVAGKTVTVTQAGAVAVPSCSYTLSNSSFAVNASSTSKNVTVTSSSSTCSWSATSNVGWITITTGASVLGDGVGSFTIAANTSSVGRTGTVTIAGKVVTITQSGKTRRKAR